MQCLMRRRREPNWPMYMMYKSTATERLASGGQTVGLAIDAEQDYLGSSIYSKMLRNLIAECLLLTPANRPSAQELVKRTKEGAETVRMSQGQILEPPLPQWQEPVVSAEWIETAGVNPLTAAVGAQPGSKPRRPPVIAQPAPSALTQATTAQTGATRTTAIRLAPAGANQAGTVQAGSVQAGATQSPNAPAVPAQSVASQLAQAAATSVVPSRPLPANVGSASRTLRVIVQTKARYGGVVAGTHKTFALIVTDEIAVFGIKDMLEQRRCGLKANKMNLMSGRMLMKNFQKLSEFPGVDNIRAMEA